MANERKISRKTAIASSDGRIELETSPTELVGCTATGWLSVTSMSVPTCVCVMRTGVSNVDMASVQQHEKERT